MFCMSLWSAYTWSKYRPLSGRFRWENTSSWFVVEVFFVGIFIWRGAIRSSLREAPHLIDWHRESQSERFHQHALRAGCAGT